MTLAGLALRSVLHRPGRHLLLALGVAVASSVLVAALVTGDSVRASLAALREARLGGIAVALDARGRPFRAALADDVAARLGVAVAPALRVEAVASRPDGERSAGGVSVWGVDDRFWSLLGVPAPALEDGIAWLADPVFEALDLRPGEELVLRVAPPRPAAVDAPLAAAPSEPIALPVRAARAPAGHALELGLNRPAPRNVFVPLAPLQERLGLSGRADLLLAGDAATAEEASRALAGAWRLEDAGLRVEIAGGEAVLAAESLLFAPPVVRALEGVAGTRVAAWFAHGLRAGDRETPYSFVAGLDVPPVPLARGEVAIGAWLAEDLGAGAGDTLAVVWDRYLDPDRGALREQRFRIAAVLPMKGPGADPTLVPRFPGFHDAPTCRDWDPTVPIDTSRIRDRDEEYWERHGTAPKVLFRLDDAKEMWGSSWGHLTGFRVSASGAAALGETLRARLDPAALGLAFAGVGEAARRSSEPATDAGALFLGFGSIVLFAALVLVLLLARLHLEARSEETETLRALGLSASSIAAVHLFEGGIAAAAGAVAGAAAGPALAAGVLALLESSWRAAVSGLDLVFAASPASLAAGGGAALLTALATIAISLRRPRRPTAGSGRGGFLAAGAALLAGAALAVHLAGDEAPAPTYFGAGALALAASLCFAASVLHVPKRRPSLPGGALGLGLREVGRSPSRSLAVVATVSLGTFVVLGVGASRPGSDPGATGGFDLLVETPAPLDRDLGTPSGRAAFGLGDEDLHGASFLPFRVRDGDDASCLHLGRAGVPRLLLADPEALARTGFRFLAEGASWADLSRDLGPDEIAVAGDEPTVVWGLGLAAGDAIDDVDERGRPYRLRITGVFTSSVLQGSLVADRRHVAERFPSAAGARLLLVRAPPGKARAIGATLSDALADRGARVEETAPRLSRFRAVERTWLAVFLATGGLGLALGALGAGVVLLRNAAERRPELAVLRAAGLSRPFLVVSLAAEHVALLAAGLLAGSASALLTAWPSLGSGPEGAAGVARDAFVIIAGTLLTGLLATLGGASVALRGPPTLALREE